jgi:DNA-binding transcriptional LysR family regulator
LPLPLGIELRHLRYFLAVYDELHFGRAAERLHIAQPPLSQAIRKLESELGTTLLDRTSRAVRPTPSGDAFAEEARKVLASFEFAVAEARRIGSGDSALRVGCVNWIPIARFQRFLTALKQRDEALRTEVTHLLSTQQADRLRSGELDLGVLALSEHYEGLEWEPLFPGEPARLFVPSAHRLAAQDVVSPPDVRSETLLTYPRAVNSAFYDNLMRMLDRAGYRFAHVHAMSAPDPRDIVVALTGGLGVVLGPASFGEMELVQGADVVAIPVDPPLEYPPMVVAWRAKPPRKLLPRLSAVREAAAELFGSGAFQAA